MSNTTIGLLVTSEQLETRFKQLTTPIKFKRLVVSNQLVSCIISVEDYKDTEIVANEISIIQGLKNILHTWYSVTITNYVMSMQMLDNDMYVIITIETLKS